MNFFMKRSQHKFKILIELKNLKTFFDIIYRRIGIAVAFQFSSHVVQ